MTPTPQNTPPSAKRRVKDALLLLHANDVDTARTLLDSATGSLNGDWIIYARDDAWNFCHEDNFTKLDARGFVDEVIVHGVGPSMAGNLCEARENADA